jgi:ABC-type sugar transport system permease subunit
MFHDVRIEFGGIDQQWIGLENFREAFGDTGFLLMIFNLIMGILQDVIVVVCFSFFISNVLNQKFIGRGAARMVFFLPVLLTTGIFTMQAQAVADMDTGIIESLTSFDVLGFGAFMGTMQLMEQLGIPDTAIPIIGFNIATFLLMQIYNIPNIINESGVQILIFLAALQSISPSLFEAAKVEGATKWEEFWKITFPMLTPMILVAIVYTIISTFTNPRYGIMTFLDEASFGTGRMGYGATLTWIYFAAIMILLGLVWLIIAKRVSYLD